MTNQTLIEQLKDKKQAKPFGLHNKEAKEIFETARTKNCFVYWTDRIWQTPVSDCFRVEFTYILKPDYKPGSEYVDLKIDLHEGFYGAWSPCKEDESVVLPFRFTHLHYLPSLPEFDCFWLDEGNSYRDGNSYVGPARIAGLMFEGKKVFARFRVCGAEK